MQNKVVKAFLWYGTLALQYFNFWKQLIHA